jgi:hypothetical protein
MGLGAARGKVSFVDLSFTSQGLFWHNAPTRVRETTDGAFRRLKIVYFLVIEN